MSKQSKRDVAGILYLISKGGKEGFPFRIRLQKMALLGKLEFSFPFSFKYESHYYGPYSVELQLMVSDLAINDFVDELSTEFEDGRHAFIYLITRRGKMLL